MEKINISKNLKKILEDRRLNAKKLAERAGVSTSRISDCLSGRTPSLKTLVLIANALSLGVEDLLVSEEEREKKSTTFEKVCSIEDTYTIRITIEKNKGKQS